MNLHRIFLDYLISTNRNLEDIIIELYWFKIYADLEKKEIKIMCVEHV